MTDPEDRDPLDAPMPAPSRTDYALAVGLAAVCVLLLWLACLYAY